MVRLPTWFSRQPLWIQEGINRLLKNGSWFGSDLDVLLVLCKKQAGIDISPGDPKDPSPLHKSDFVTQTSSTANLRLNQIANIEGINALAPKRPLEFGKTNLCLIYGGSGSGKSGYVRILKHACGAREIGRLLGNTFDSTNAKQKATIKYDINDNKFEKEFTTETGRIEELLPVEIFDTACSRVYVSKENEVAIEPDLLGFFSDLVFACGKLETKLDTEISKKPSSKPSIPHELDGTISERWFANISCDTTDVDIDEKTQWTDNEQIELQECTSHLAVNEPIKEALKYRNVVIQIENLLGDIKNINDAINETGTIEFRELFTAVATKKNVVKVAAENAFASAPLDGIGSDVWLELWKAARLFSEQKAYPNETFPNVNSDALCVLCQQSLNDDAKKRFKTFEEFVNDTLQKQAQIAENTLIKKNYRT